MSLPIISRAWGRSQGTECVPHCGECHACAESPPSLRNSEMDKASLDESRAVAEKTTTADLWNWAHHVAAAASSPSAVQEALLEEGRNTAKSFVGAAKGVRQFWSGQLHSRILSAISRLKRPRSILEIGAFVGISCGAPHFPPRVHWLISIRSTLNAACLLPASP